MSDSSKMSIISVNDNYCEIKIEQYVNSEDSALNESIKDDINIRNATLYAYLLDLSNYYYTFKGTEILNDQIGNSFYNVKEANEIIAKTEIIEWNDGPANLMDPETKAIYEERVLRLLESEKAVLSDLRKMDFTTRVYFRDNIWLKGLKTGMQNSTTLDTWICDWL